MTRPILLLARLNDLDLAVDATKTRLAEIAEALREPAALASARRSAADLQKEVDRLRTEQRSLEHHQADLEQKIEKTETRLYSGEVTSPRELAEGRSGGPAARDHGRAGVSDGRAG